jgi:hypothetical protein
MIPVCNYKGENHVSFWIFIEWSLQTFELDLVLAAYGVATNI